LFLPDTDIPNPQINPNKTKPVLNSISDVDNWIFYQGLKLEQFDPLWLNKCAGCFIWCNSFVSVQVQYIHTMRILYTIQFADDNQPIHMWQIQVGHNTQIPIYQNSYSMSMPLIHATHEQWVATTGWP